MRYLIFVLVWIVFAPSNSLAQHQVDDCKEAEYEVARGKCLAEVLEDLNTKLAQLNESALKSIEKASYMDEAVREEWKGLYRASHRQWESHRSMDCRLVRYEWWGGSGGGNAMLKCEIFKTRLRIEELETRY